ncbi:MAG: L-aspartate oxidase [Spirochaetes bacterium]|nr:L-aspartate oxidase [Spirochaetota bacterium]
MKKIFDVIIIGSGISGLTAGILLKESGFDTVVLTKTDNIEESNTQYAQGGIIAWKNEDSPEKLSNDIINAGDKYNNLSAVKEFSDNAPKLVFDFLIDKIGIDFSKDNNNNIDYTGEAAHSIRRIVHYSDHTGEKIEKSLVNYAKKIKLNVLTSSTSIDLITNYQHSKDIQELYKEREVMGVYVLDNKSKEITPLFAYNVILATGGLGNLYQYTTNPPSATGDGLSMAYKTGADIINTEFIQFHPTSLFHKDIKRFLISESLRGEGARLIDHKGKEFMSKYHSLKDLAPRDIVARAIYEEIYKNGVEYMYLDLYNYYKGKEPIEKRFSKIYNTCLKGGIDITKSPIPIVPASHYFCGGVKIDLSGRTTIKNLYAIGEISCSGLHGANRLASVSLLEGLYWAKKACEDIISKKNHIKNDRFNNIKDWKTPKKAVEFDPILIDQDWRVIKLTMWNYAGIIRTKSGLSRAIADLSYYAHRIYKFYKEAKLDKSIIELRNAITNSQIIVNAALRNEKTIGCHYLINDV